jgi:hypothetical protein
MEYYQKKKEKKKTIKKEGRPVQLICFPCENRIIHALRLYIFYIHLFHVVTHLRLFYVTVYPSFQQKLSPFFMCNVQYFGTILAPMAPLAIPACGLFSTYGRPSCLLIQSHELHKGPSGVPL